MRQSMRPVWGLFIILAGVLGISAMAKLFQAKEIVPWRNDFAAAREEGRRTNKPVFAYFTADWCAPCQSMKGTTWADRGVEAALRDYVPVRIDIDKHADLAQAYAIDGVPTFAVLDTEGRVVKTTTGALQARDFLQWLK